MEEVVGLGENAVSGALAPVAVGLSAQHLLVGHRGTGISNFVKVVLKKQ